MSDLAAFFRFSAVGAIGFAVDATILSLMLSLGSGFYSGRACSYSIGGAVVLIV